MKGIDNALETFKEKVQGLKTRGYPEAYSEGLSLYNEFALARNNLIKNELTPVNIDICKTEFDRISKAGEEGKLGEFRDFKMIFKHIADAVVRLFTLNFKHLNSDSVDKMKAIKQGVIDLKEPSPSRDESQNSP